MKKTHTYNSDSLLTEIAEYKKGFLYRKKTYKYDSTKAKKKLLMVFVLSLINAAVFSQSSEIKIFWSEFNKAVVAKDTLKLATMIDYSVYNGLIGKDTTEFYRNFGSLFDPKTVEIMAKTESLTGKRNNEYVFVGSGAYKFFKFKKIKRKYKLYHVSYYD